VTSTANEPVPEPARAILAKFELPGELVELVAHDSGHIHDTYISTWLEAGRACRYLHQRMNVKVFTDIPALMHNIELVTRHLDAARVGGPGELESLVLVPTRSGRAYLLGDDGPWRTYHYIDGTESFDQCVGAEQAFEAARAFGQFQARLLDLDASELRDTIPNFFSTPHRLRQFEDALASDPKGRRFAASAELDFVLQRRGMVPVIDEYVRAGRIPLRVVHGDTKLNNVLFDVDTGKARCIVDLDTCMPAYSLYDFGDLVRFSAATSSEDERDLDAAGMELDLYRALVRGYLDAAAGFLNELELELMPLAARLVTFTIGLRFLTDHLAGDVYFKTAREGHNLDRARVQFKMVEEMERMERSMRVR
jgi:Ser/Thr protein kinase RdoA (MazF antagonist)